MCDFAMELNKFFFSLTFEQFTILVVDVSYPSSFQFSMPQTTLEMATVEKLIHIPEDSVPCKIRAKRGCATHPRSIAERVSKNSEVNYLLILYVILTVRSNYSVLVYVS
jgi:hypothetical protein